MAGFLNSLLSGYREQLERRRNEPFLRAVMAASALVAIADGSIAFSQRIRVDQILETLETLKIFDPHDGVNLFNRYAEAILEASEPGRARAVEAIKPLARDPETAELLVRVCLAISEANGEISLVEQIEIVTLCSLLDIDPKNCGLYVDLSPEELITGRRGEA